MPVSLIITVYKDYQALELVLESVKVQTVLPSQIILAHDTIDDPIFEVLDKFNKKLNISYINQEDTGFNKNRILNKAILKSTNDQIVFIDGDCLLHSRCIEAYEKQIKQGFFAAGRRLDLDEKSSKKLRKKGFFHPSLFKLFLNGTKRIEEGYYLPFVDAKKLKTPKMIGCNMGWHKEDLLSINGFDMDYLQAGYGEDTDIEWRASLKGILPLNMRWKAIQYHLFHERPDRESEIQKSKSLFQSKREKGYFYCENGISQLVQDFNH